MTRPRGTLLAASALSALVSLVVMVQLAPSAWGHRRAVVALMLSTAALGVTWCLPLVQWVAAAWASTPRRHAWRTLGGSVVGALVLSVADPSTPAPLRFVEVVVEPLDDREVRVRVTADDLDTPLDRFDASEGWSQRDGFWLWTPQTEPSLLRWRGYVASHAELGVLRTPESGRVRVRGDGRDVVLDLHGDEVTHDSFELTPSRAVNRLFPWTNRGPLQLLYDLLLVALVTAALFSLVAAFTFAQVPWPHLERSLLADVWRLSTPMLWLGLWLLAVFSPGLVTSDSVDQWLQASQGTMNDAHPVLHTLLVSALGRPTGTPTLFIAAQLFALAVATGGLIAVLQRALHAPAGAAALSAWLVHPMVAICAVTLWKDVLYTAAVIGLVAWSAARVLLSPRARPSVWEAVGAGTLAFGAIAIRHNGPPAALAAFFLVAWLAPAARRAAVIAAVTAFVLFAALRLPVVRLMGIKPSSVSHLLYVHRIAAHLAANQWPAEETDRRLLADIESAPDWHYRCATINQTIFTPSFNPELAAAHADDLGRVWRELALAHPREELEHSLCGSSLIWRMDDADTRVLYLSKTAVGVREGRVSWVDPLHGVLHEDSLFPSAAARVGRAVLDSDAWWLWRPAVWLWLFTFAVLVAALRAENRRVLSLLAVLWVHSVTVGAVTPAQDARYQLPAYVLACVLPVLFTARRHKCNSLS